MGSDQEEGQGKEEAAEFSGRKERTRAIASGYKEEKGKEED